MAIPEPTLSIRRQQPTAAKRLVKTYLPVELVRSMDALILASNGAYDDRSEFVAEAIADRLAEETYGNGHVSAGVVEEPMVVKVAPESNGDVPIDEEAVSFGDWLDGWSAINDKTVLPAAEGPSANFGLHNRDLPTLWTLDWLGRLVERSGEPIPWRHFETQIIPRAWAMGRQLQAVDIETGAAIKNAAGFPTNTRKREASERRFFEHAAGAIAAHNRGPLFVFRAIGVHRVDDDNHLVAPTEAGVALLTDLVATGLTTLPPFPAKAWATFSAHLQEWAPEELTLWRRVLAVVAEEPDREALVRRCDWWTGSTADTNVASYIARGREWGLVEPKLVAGRYRLTELGQAEAASTQEVQ
jgi:Arc/MetJ-type ribon-helix-helix transcriptional regulator